jgi:hypothetical protein
MNRPDRLGGNWDKGEQDMATPPFAVQKSKTTVGQKLLITAGIVVGTLILIGSAANYLNKQRQVGPPVLSTTDSMIAASEYGHVQIGDTLTDAKAYLGTPSDVQRSDAAGSVSTCIYYDDVYTGESGVYQFCFDNGTLTSKAKY